ncbi:uncharacterized protein G2W53_022140 [Senna tora]|uniref:Uncharacterized protein n=1 Tax=Senna tora TaxID=362788 RepID=A0A834TMZ8_9FABA|nr:uncharacterized protein G2W53_022140 [Senna tora]
MAIESEKISRSTSQTSCCTSKPNGSLRVVFRNPRGYNG